MLNFAEQTGSGAVMLVWSFSTHRKQSAFIYNVFENSDFVVSIFKTSLNVVDRDSDLSRICFARFPLCGAAKIPRENFSWIPYLFLVPEEIEFGELFFEELAC